MKLRRILAVIAALTLVLAACGGTETSPAQTAAPDTAVTTTVPADGPTDDTMADEMTDDTMVDEDMAAEDMNEDEMDDAAVNPFADLQVAAEAVGNNANAKALAGGIAEATGMDGDINSPAAQTYAELSTLLQEHVYLAGIAIDTGLSFGLDSAEFGAAAGVLDGNSVELADVIGSVAPDQREAFLQLWRDHIGFFVDYTAAVAGQDDDAREQALLNLGGYGSAAGAFFETLTNGELPATAMETALAGHIDSLTAAIDAAVAGDATVTAKLKMAADHVGENGSAKAIATAVVAATGMEGSVDSAAAQTYATLSTLLEEHTYLAGIAVATAYSEGLDSEAFGAAATTLDSNSVELASLIGTVAPDQEQAFLDLWRDHVGFFVDYAVGAISGDDAMVEQAKVDLGGYGTAAGQFFETISGGVIQESAVESGLANHIDTLGAAIESLAATS